jgi:glycosyltransferase involved in cell wall biosynthesis
MKLLVFAHTPPPHHGQSYMVRLMLDGFGGDCRRDGRSASPHDIECYHVNARFSKKLEDIGDFRLGKFLLLLGFCLQAIWCRFRYGVENFYYIPAPGKRSALYRDWVVMWICRPFFKRLILHWHAAGLAKWLETVVRIRSRSLTFSALKYADLSVVLSNYNRSDAEKIFSRDIRIVSNGIPDPCPAFDRDILPDRKRRRAARARLVAGQSLSATELADEPHVIKVLYLAHCMREKGLFDAVSGVLAANARLGEQRSPLSLRLLIAGNFVSDEERQEFERMVSRDAAHSIRHLGFVSGDEKHRLLRTADLFSFPTYYPNENQPVNLIEAMAYGLPIVTTRWRSLPELFPANYAGLVDVRSPDHVAAAMLRVISGDDGEAFRRIFQENFTLQRYLTGLAHALHDLEQQSGSTAPAPARAGGGRAA